MTGLNENHRKRLLSTFRTVDQMLADALRALDTTQAPSPFSELVPDAAPIQHKVMTDHVAQLRAGMCRLMETNGIALDRPSVSAVWHARCLLMSIEAAIEELRPRYMRGYGDLSDDAQHDLNLIVTQLFDILGRMQHYLAQGSGRELRARLERLGATTDEAGLVGELERVITDRGLVEFRTSLAMLVERLEANVLEVAIFGRVSSGKSSLLDYLLQTDVLPVGVTPVTAVPVRITQGPAPRATIWFAQEPAVTVDPRRVVEFASEQGNPGNAKRVTRILVELPSPRLQEGVVFVDTPGLGSLAAGGAAEALAYLPRCDMGIVLTDASSALAPEDLSLIEALCQAGAQVMLLLSKADLTTPQETVKALDYAQTQVRNHVGFDVPIYPVSVRGESAILCDRWLAEALLPALGRRRQLARQSMRRKVGDLRERVAAALRRRVDRPTPSTSGTSEKLAAASAVLNNMLVRLDAARQEHLDWSDRLSALVSQWLDGVAQRAASQWPADQPASQEIAPLFAPVAAEHIGGMVMTVVAGLTTLDVMLADALRQAAQALGRSAQDEDLPHPKGVPVFDPAQRLPTLVVVRPVLAVLGPGVLRHGIRRQLDGPVAVMLAEWLSEYVRQLDAWRSGYLNDLRQAFTAQADAYQTQLRELAGQPLARPANETAAIRQDIVRLESFEGETTSPETAPLSGVRPSR